MIFSSTIFIFLFLPLALSAYFLLKARYRNLYLLIVSLVFYTWGDGQAVAVLVSVTVVNYLCALGIGSSSQKSAPDPALSGPGPRGTIFLAGSLLFDLGVLFYFKYFSFLLVDVLGGAVGAPADGAGGWGAIPLPLGISFFTFQAMSYVIDVYRGVVPVTRSYIDFSCYVTCFPQLIAGPIVRYRDIMDQLKERVLSLSGFAAGIRRFTIGLAKKVLIANTVAGASDQIFSIPVEQLSPELVWIGAVCFSIQIYYDFSGYSDMAIGLGAMLGFRFPENFNYPYMSTSIREFWRRWHISLSTWFRDYLYIPLGGNKGSKVRTYCNLWTVFILCGLWHGASWTFVVWGMYHGFWLVVERAGLGAVLDRLPSLVRRLYALAVVMIGWLVFRADSLPQAGKMLSAGLGLGQAGYHPLTLRYYLQNDELAALLLGLLFSFPVAAWVDRKALKITPRFYRSASQVALAGIFAVCALRIIAGSSEPFLYFRF